MAFPPPVLPIDRQDSTQQDTQHPQDHNQVNQAVNDTVAKVQSLENATSVSINQLRRRGVFLGRTSNIQPGVVTNIFFAPPAAGSDPDGFWVPIVGNPSLGELFIPAGLGGLYLMTFHMAFAVVPSAVLSLRITTASAGAIHHTSTDQDQTFTTSAIANEGQKVVPGIYNGGSGSSAQVTFSMYRIGG